MPRPGQISGIYKIVNTINGYFYVGSSVQLQERWRQHKKLLVENKHINPKLQNAWNSYGADAFVFQVLEVTRFDKQGNVVREQYYLDTLKPYERTIGYNLCAKAAVPPGPHTKEAREKISKANKGRKRTGQALANIKEANRQRTGKHHWTLSEESKRKHSIANKGKKRTAEYCKRSSEQAKLKFVGLSAEERKQYVLDSIGIPTPEQVIRRDEHMRQLGKARKGKPLSETAKQKMRNRVVSSETRKKLSQANQGKKKTPEQRLAMSLKMKAVFAKLSPEERKQWFSDGKEF